MKNEHIYSKLKEIAGQIDVKVEEKNLQIPGLRVKSGLCIIEGKKVFIMDKHKKLKEKIEIIATCIGFLENEDIYIVPAIRELINKYRKKNIKLEKIYAFTKAEYESQNIA